MFLPQMWDIALLNHFCKMTFTLIAQTPPFKQVAPTQASV